MDAYPLHEGRFIQVAYANSGANGLSIGLPAVPAGKIWTVLQGLILNDVAGGETQYIWFGVGNDGVLYYPVTRPVQQLINPTTFMYFPLLTEGMELKLWPGDVLVARRAAATVGSTFSIYIRYIESDMPLYEYIEPQIKSRLLRSTIATMQRSGAGAVSRSLPPRPGREGGGGGGVPPV